MSRSFLESLLLSASLAIAVAGPAHAADPVQQHNSNAVWFENFIGLSNATMVVAAPNGKISQIYAESGTPVFELNPAEAVDGVYRYELRAATEERRTIVNASNLGGDEEQSDPAFVPYYSSGHFVVKRGVIITPKEIKQEE
jgi:opacity protein-like surface antigen